MQVLAASPHSVPKSVDAKSNFGRVRPVIGAARRWQRLRYDFLLVSYSD